MKFSEFLRKLREKPEPQKKIIIWAITVFLGIILAGLWIYYAYYKVSNFNADSFIKTLNPPDFGKDIEKARQDAQELGQPLEESIGELKDANALMMQIQGATGENSATEDKTF